MMDGGREEVRGRIVILIKMCVCACACVSK